jgi:hypothetical protein
MAPLVEKKLAVVDHRLDDLLEFVRAIRARLPG